MTRWLQEHFWKLLVAAFVAFGGVAVDRFSDEIQAWVRSIFFEGIGGTYVLETWTYSEDSPPKPIPWVQTCELKDAGRTVFGVLRSQKSGTEYRFFGHHRVKFLMISYGGKGPLGGGTLALQTEIAEQTSPVFWGWRTSVECIGPDAYFVQCPALMVKQGSKIPAKVYDAFFQARHCWTVTRDKPPELCDDLKARAKRSMVPHLKPNYSVQPTAFGRG